MPALSALFFISGALQRLSIVCASKVRGNSAIQSRKFLMAVPSRPEKMSHRRLRRILFLYLPS